MDNSDGWIVANGVFWNFSALGAAYLVFRRNCSRNIALAACAILALLPQFLYYGANARMYSFMITMALIVWWLTDKLFEAGSGERAAGKTWKLLLLRAFFQLMLGYAHAVGPLYAFFGAAYALALAYKYSPAKTRKRWFVAETATGLLLLPVVINSMFRETQHASTGSLSDWSTLLWNNIFTSYSNMPGLWAAVIMLGMLAAIYWRIRADAAYTRVFWLLLILPIGMFFAVSLTVKPIMSDRGFAILLPAFSLLAAAALAQTSPGFMRRFGLFSVFLAILGWKSIAFVGDYKKPNDFSGVAQHLEASAVKGDQLFAYQGATAWGMLRRLMGPNWGSALDIQAPPNERWHRLEDRLGSNLCKLIRICAERSWLEHQGMHIDLFHDEMLLDMKGKRIWVLHNGAQPVDRQIKALAQEGYVWQYDKNFSGEVLRLFTREAASDEQ